VYHYKPIDQGARGSKELKCFPVCVTENFSRSWTHSIG
jgi:hypothetical protein